MRQEAAITGGFFLSISQVHGSTLPWSLASSLLLAAHVASPPNVSRTGVVQIVNGLRKDGQLEQKEEKAGVKVHLSDMRLVK